MRCLRNLPAHHQHQTKPKEQKAECRNAILQPNHLVIGRENIRSPESGLVVMGFVHARMWNGLGCLHSRYSNNTPVSQTRNIFCLVAVKIERLVNWSVVFVSTADSPDTGLLPTSLCLTPSPSAAMANTKSIRKKADAPGRSSTGGRTGPRTRGKPVPGSARRPDRSVRRDEIQT